MISLSVLLTVQMFKKNQLYHLTLHCEVRSASEMVSVAPRRRAEATNRNLRSILKAGRYQACVQRAVKCTDVS